MYVREVSPRIAKVHGQFVVSPGGANVPTVINTHNPCRVEATTGTVLVTTLSTAPASTDCWQLVAGEVFRVQPESTGGLALMAATTTATAQVMEVIE